MRPYQPLPVCLWGLPIMRTQVGQVLFLGLTL